MLVFIPETVCNHAPIVDVNARDANTLLCRCTQTFENNADTENDDKMNESSASNTDKC